MKNRIMDNYVKRFCIVLRTKELFLKDTVIKNADKKEFSVIQLLRWTCKACNNNENIVLYK